MWRWPGRDPVSFRSHTGAAGLGGGRVGAKGTMGVPEDVEGGTKEVPDDGTVGTKQAAQTGELRTHLRVPARADCKADVHPVVELIPTWMERHTERRCGVRHLRACRTIPSLFLPLLLNITLTMSLPPSFPPSPSLPLPLSHSPLSLSPSIQAFSIHPGGTPGANRWFL